MICAVHQPNFFPWLGYFAKIAKADVFVFQDVVLWSKRSYSNRVKLLLNGEPTWVTGNVRRKESNMYINEMEFADEHPWRKKLIRQLYTNYHNTPFYDRMMPFVETLIMREGVGLAEYNALNIQDLSEVIGLECRFVRHSGLWHATCFSETGSRRIIAICQEIGADTYLAGDGSEGYECPEEYAEAGIGFVKNNFIHPEYEQSETGQFVPGLSILDALFNLGTEAVKKLLTD